VIGKADFAPVIRFAALAFAVLAICLAAAELDRSQAGGTSTVAVTIADPAGSELARCRAITDPAQVDDACRRAWAERRARFFSSPETRP
jgi:conjugative transfer region protein TrbK